METMKYYHGGIGGLRLGEYILPSSETGAISSCFYGAPAKSDKVYITTDYLAALMFASMSPSKNAAVYEVEPTGELTPDPDCLEIGLSFECPKAKIIRRMPLPQYVRRPILQGLLSR